MNRRIRPSTAPRSAGRLAVVCASVLLAGCGSAVNLLNPDFAASLGLTQSVALLPGEAPSVLFEVENAAGRTIEAQLSWRDPEGDVVTRTMVIPAESKLAETVICPVSEVTLGDVGNLRSTGAIVRLGTGGANDPIVEVEPFGVLLQEGVNYDCGDSVSFRVQLSGATLSGYQIYAFIRRSDTSP